MVFMCVVPDVGTGEQGGVRGSFLILRMRATGGVGLGDLTEVDELRVDISEVH